MMTIGEGGNSWTWQQNKAFENGLVIYHENYEQRWENIASQIPGDKTPLEVKQHYELLLDDIATIEAGITELPKYPNKARSSERDLEWESRKGQAWTEEEHKQFLLGMEKYGKGDWKTIAKDFVKTRTATQVASHAQKHFKRQEKTKKAAKRWSIFDITNPNNNNVNITKLVAIEAANDVGKNVAVTGHVSPPLSSRRSWCPDSDDEDVVDSSFQECLSRLSPL